MLQIQGKEIVWRLMELLAGNNGDLGTHVLVAVEAVAQAHLVLLNGDPGCCLRGFSTRAAHVDGSLKKKAVVDFFFFQK